MSLFLYMYNSLVRVSVCHSVTVACSTMEEVLHAHPLLPVESPLSHPLLSAFVAWLFEVRYLVCWHALFDCAYVENAYVFRIGRVRQRLCSGG